MKLKISFITIVTAGLFLAGCELQQQSAEPYSDISTDGLRLQLEVEPAQITVNPEEEFTVTYSVQNNNPEKVKLVSGCTAFARGMVFRQEEVVRLEGSSDVCFTAISSYEIPAGEKLELEWQVKPFSLKTYPDDREPDTTLAEAGKYTFRVKPDIMKINGEETSLPDIERKVVLK
ncbi:hypothetical protein [Fodinibius roseus]|nr:hypothetical protein [Fodinibius roseus]